MVLIFGTAGALPPAKGTVAVLLIIPVPGQIEEMLRLWLSKTFSDASCQTGHRQHAA